MPDPRVGAGHGLARKARIILSDFCIGTLENFSLGRVDFLVFCKFKLSKLRISFEKAGGMKDAFDWQWVSSMCGCRTLLKIYYKQAYACNEILLDIF